VRTEASGGEDDEEDEDEEESEGSQGGDEDYKGESGVRTIPC